MGVRYLIATGNDADLGVAELTRTVAADPDIKLILVYVEAVNNPEMLAQAASIARGHGARIVLLKGGNSKRGAIASAHAHRRTDGGRRCVRRVPAPSRHLARGATSTKWSMRRRFISATSIPGAGARS